LPPEISDPVNQSSEKADDFAYVSDSKVVARNAIWSVVGRAAPMIVAIALTPRLIHMLGDSRWGVFTIALSLTGMMGLFDFGIGRALTRTVAVSLGDNKDAGPSVMTGIVALTALGFVGTLLLGLFVEFWTRSALKVPVSMQMEVRISLYLLCLAVPLILLNGALFGVLSAFQRQRQVSLINIPIMILYYAGPLASFFFYPSLVGVILVLVFLRAIMTYGYWLICLQCMPSLKTARPSWEELKPLAKLGGWMTVSNLAWPLLSYIDRFVIASVVSAAVTGFYVTPSDLISRAYLVPTAVTTSAFPAIAASYIKDKLNTANIFRRSVLAIAGALFVPSLLVVAFSNQILQIWLGAEFASHASVVFHWFGIGIMMACCDIAPGMLDAIGMPKMNALFSIGEIVCYVPLIMVLVRFSGLEGAAIAWAIRVLLDFLIRSFLATRFYPPIARAALKAGTVVVLGTALLWLPDLAPSILGKAMLCLLSITTFAPLVWFGSMSVAERSYLRGKIFGIPPQVPAKA
jgi:O-antigen/teichoic acid export membrane protein